VPRVRSKEQRPDESLMRSFGQRDPAAAEVLYERFAARIYGLGIVMLGNEPAAQDLVQDTFVKLWRSADRFDQARGRLDTWVLLVARSLAIDALRRRVLEARTAEAAQPGVDVSAEPGPDEMAEAGDLATRARRAMTTLSPGQRAALELAYFGGKTSAEVAELEGIPLGTAKTRIRTALLKLREELEERREM
jgi:RNA polymerase sigma-70 factor, ECF subfamily